MKEFDKNPKYSEFDVKYMLAHLSEKIEDLYYELRYEPKPDTSMLLLLLAGWALHAADNYDWELPRQVNFSYPSFPYYKSLDEFYLDLDTALDDLEDK